MMRWSIDVQFHLYSGIIRWIDLMCFPERNSNIPYSDFSEYVKKLTNIYHYNCLKKNEFIKKGLGKDGQLN